MDLEKNSTFEELIRKALLRERYFGVAYLLIGLVLPTAILAYSNEIFKQDVSVFSWLLISAITMSAMMGFFRVLVSAIDPARFRILGYGCNDFHLEPGSTVSLLICIDDNGRELSGDHISIKKVGKFGSPEAFALRLDHMFERLLSEILLKVKIRQFPKGWGARYYPICILRLFGRPCIEAKIDNIAEGVHTRLLIVGKTSG